MEIKAQSLNEAVILLSRALIKDGQDTTRRGFKCREIPEAVLVVIENPCERYVNIPQRKWNKTLGWIESLWLARGDNSLEMPSAYVKNLLTFSDDGRYMRAGYGPRIRCFGSNLSTMEMADGTVAIEQYGEDSGYKRGVDQLRFVLEKFYEDIDTREAVITIHDPVADDFMNRTGRLLHTKDTPCTRSIHFMMVNGKLNCYVHIRSNDLIWGFSAVNVFNFTFMQEYVAMMLGVPVGSYYHYADNLHVYEEFIPLADTIAQENILDYPPIVWYYPQEIHTLGDFDLQVAELSRFESSKREKYDLFEAFVPENALFWDWARVIARKWAEDKSKVSEFENPLLTRLFLGK